MKVRFGDYMKKLIDIISLISGDHLDVEFDDITDIDVDEEMPVIRACHNCKWSINERYSSSPFCKVRGESQFNPRLRAIFCRHYKKS